MEIRKNTETIRNGFYFISYEMYNSSQIRIARAMNQIKINEISLIDLNKHLTKSCNEAKGIDEADHVFIVCLSRIGR